MKSRFAEFDAAMAQDIVGGGGMEIEIRQTEIYQERLPFSPGLNGKKNLVLSEWNSGQKCPSNTTA